MLISLSHLNTDPCQFCHLRAEQAPPTNVIPVWFQPGVVCGLHLLLGLALVRVFLRDLRFSFPLKTNILTRQHVVSSLKYYNILLFTIYRIINLLPIITFVTALCFQIDQSVFTVCPSRPDIRPGMILVFELFILRGSVTATDRVVGWGCFPICDGEFNIVDGKWVDFSTMPLLNRKFYFMTELHFRYWLIIY